MSLGQKRVHAHKFNSSVSSLFFSVLMLCAACGVALAQGGVGSTRGLPSSSGGNNVIQGKVIFSSEPKEGRRVKVVLTSTDFLDQTTSTNDDGTFSFNGLPVGHYTVTVDGGKEFDSASEPVSIDREASPGARNLQVSILLKPKGTAAAFNKIPKTARDLYSKGTESAAKGDSKKAVEQFNGALAIYPEFSQALYEVGKQYMSLNQPDKAAESFNAALKLSPDDPFIRLNYGIALFTQKKYPEAEEQLRLALKKNHNSPSGHMYLGLTLAKQNKLEEAVTELQESIKLGGNEMSKAHYFLGGVYWSKGEFPQAADELETYLKLTPKEPNAEKLRATIKDLRSKKQ
jgi:Tfp pilus assembly protein PilF